MSRMALDTVGSPPGSDQTHIQMDLISNKTTSAIPNGGLAAWLQCAGSFFLFFNCWGVVNSFGGTLHKPKVRFLSNSDTGVFQTFYERELLTEQTSSNISWIGSIQAFLLVFVGVVTGPLFDHGYIRALIVTGSFLVIFGMMMTSLCTAYWQIMLSQGCVVGLGCGCLFVPSVAIIPTYFSTKKALALGIAASGSSLGESRCKNFIHRLTSGRRTCLSHSLS